MADVKISALPSGTSLVDTDTLPVVRAGVTTAVNTGTLVTDVSALKSGPGYTALDQSAWTWKNQGSATVTQANNIVSLLSPTAAGTNLRARLKGSYPSASFTLIVAVRPWMQFAGNLTGLSAVGFVISDGTKYKFTAAASFNFTTAANPSAVWTARYNTTTSASTATVIDNIQLANAVVWLKLVDDLSTTQTFSYSLDGVTYVQILSETRTNFLTPTDMGVAILSQSGSQNAGGAILSWAQT